MTYWHPFQHWDKQHGGQMALRHLFPKGGHPAQSGLVHMADALKCKIY